MKIIGVILSSVIPLILLSSVLCVLITVWFWERKRNVKLGLVKKFLVGTFVAYLYILLGIVLFDIFLTWKLSTYDLDGNNIFSPYESTENQAIFSRWVVHDTGRNFSPIWAAVYAPCASLLMLIVTKFIDFFQSRGG